MVAPNLLSGARAETPPSPPTHGPAAMRLALVLATVALLQVSLPLLSPHGAAAPASDSGQIAKLEAANARLAQRVADLEARPAPVDWVAVAARVEPSIFTVVAGDDLGSAWVVGNNHEGSELATNYHVVASNWEAGRAAVELHQGDALYPATVVTVDAADDLALIEVDQRFPVLPTAGSRLPLGTPVMALGSPLGLDGSVSTGIVASYRSVDGADFMQFTAPISPGNSGGPVVDAGGDVVGVSTEKAVGDGVEALGFAIPVQVVCQALRPGC